MAKFTFDGPNHLINLQSPNTDFTVVELHSEAMDFHDGATGMALVPPTDANGNFILGGGVNSDSIIRILEPWKLKPYDGTYTLVVNGTLITDGGTDLDYNTQTVAFTIGKRVIGQTSDTNGLIVADTTPGVGDGTLTVVNISGTGFEVGETIIDEDGGTAIAGTPSDVETAVNVPPDTGNVTIRIIAASSGTVAFSEEVLDQSYQGQAKVYIDTDRGAPGTTFPKGTPTDPVNNFNDAATIAEARKFFQYHLEGALTLTAGNDFADTDWFGNQPIQSELRINGGNTGNCVFHDMHLHGTLDGEVNALGCHLEITNWWGAAHHCQLAAISLDASADEAHFYNCFSDIAGPTTPTLDFNGAAANAMLRNYSGGVALTNSTAPGMAMSIDLVAGQVIVDSSCTEGTLVVRGVGKLTDNSGINFTVDSDGLVNPETVADQTIATVVTGLTGGDGTLGGAVNFIRQMEAGRWRIIGDQMIMYDVDNVTEVARFNLFDINGVATTTGDVFERQRV